MLRLLCSRACKCDGSSVFFQHAQNCQTIGLMTQSHKADAPAPVTAGARPASPAGAGPASITATLAMVSPAEPLAAAASSSTARRLRETGVFRTQVHGGTRRWAFPFWCPTAQRSGKPCSPPPLAQRRLTPSTLDAFGDLARGVPCIKRFHFRYQRTPGTRPANAAGRGVWGTCTLTTDGSPEEPPERK